MKKLKIKFKRVENVILMKVLEQDKSLRNEGKIFTALNGISLESVSYPELQLNRILLRGSNSEKDNNYISYDFKTVVDTKEQLRKYIEAIKEFNQSITTKKYNTDTEDIETIIVE